MARGLVRFILLCAAVLIGTAGCGDNKDANPAPQAPAQFTAARKTFDTKCINCHTIGAGKKKGPDLAKVAAPAEHTRDWILNYIRDPQTQKPDSKMPKFGDKLNDEEIGALADYLATLK